MVTFDWMRDQDVALTKIISPYLFRNQEWMDKLPLSDKDWLRQHGKLKKLKRGEWLFKQGTIPRQVVWLISGKVKILQETPGGQRQTLYIYSNGDLIGFRQLIAEELHPVSAVLLEDAEVILIPAISFKKLMEVSPAFVQGLLLALARDFTVWMNRMTIFTKFPVRHRLVLALLILHEQYRLSGSVNGEITITRTELSEYVGASLETIVRSLHGLKGKDLVQIKGRHIQIMDVSGLLALLLTEDI
jgi:CRP-like cAMP-binding protein